MGKWNITKLIAIASLAALYLILNIAGSVFTTTSGVIGFSGLIFGFVPAMILAFCSLLIRKFGAATILMFILGTLGIPLPIFGTPGFLPKIFICLGIGLSVDIIFLLLRKRPKIAAITLGAVSRIVWGTGMISIGLLFSLPGIEKYSRLFLNPVMLLVLIVSGMIGGYLGYLIHTKLQNTSIVKRIQA